MNELVSRVYSMYLISAEKAAMDDLIILFVLAAKLRVTSE